MRKRAITLGIVMLLTALVANPGSAGHLDPGPPTTTLNVQPDGIHGNPSCSDLIDSGLFLFEFKLEPVESGTFPLSFDGLSGSLTVTVKNTAGGQLFDFEFSGAFVAAGIFVKGGPNGNLYDYVDASFAPGAAADTDLHAPVNPQNNKFYGLSHISFCIAQAPAELEIVKTAVDETIGIGDHAAFDITVTSLGPSTALDVTIDDELPNAVLNWEVVSENPAMGACSISGGNTLECVIGDLAKDATFTVRVQTTDPISLEDALCGELLDNTAFADADNADQVSDDAEIDVQCPDVKVEKSGNGTISEGTEAQYSITVTNLGPGTATDVELDDDLPNSGLTWSVTTQPSQGSCSIVEGDLECSLGDMADGLILTIEVSTPTDSADCATITNFAEVSASNEDPEKLGNNEDSEDITIQCGAIQISKTAKHADAPNSSPDLGATFEIVDEEGNTHTITTNSDGFGCADGVALGETQSITETVVPAGYAAPEIEDVEVVVGECADGTLASGGVTVDVVNVPLTDILVEAFSQVDGGTLSMISCVDTMGTEETDDDVPIGDASGFIASLSVEDLVPGTYVCTIVIDP